MRENTKPTQFELVSYRGGSMSLLTARLAD